MYHKFTKHLKASHLALKRETIPETTTDAYNSSDEKNSILVCGSKFSSLLFCSKFGGLTLACVPWNTHDSVHILVKLPFQWWRSTYDRTVFQQTAKLLSHHTSRSNGASSRSAKYMLFVCNKSKIAIHLCNLRCTAFRYSSLSNFKNEILFQLRAFCQSRAWPSGKSPRPFQAYRWVPITCRGLFNALLQD